jgi:hypothetical protein
MCILLAIRHFGEAGALQVVNEAVKKIVATTSNRQRELHEMDREQLMNVMNDDFLFAHGGLFDDNSNLPRISYDQFYLVWSLFMLFQDLPIDGNNNYHESIWPEWHKQALIHCNALSTQLMISDFKERASMEEISNHSTTEELIGLSPSVDLLLLGLGKATIDDRITNRTSQYKAVSPVLLVNASVIGDTENSGGNKRPIDLVQYLQSFSRLQLDKHYNEHYALKDVARACRDYTDWYKKKNDILLYQDENQNDKQEAIATLFEQNKTARISMTAVLKNCGDIDTFPLSPELVKAMIPAISLDLVRIYNWIFRVYSMY